MAQYKDAIEKLMASHVSVLYWLQPAASAHATLRQTAEHAQPRDASTRMYCAACAATTGCVWPAEAGLVHDSLFSWRCVACSIRPAASGPACTAAACTRASASMHKRSVSRWSGMRLPDPDLCTRWHGHRAGVPLPVPSLSIVAGQVVVLALYYACERSAGWVCRRGSCSCCLCFVQAAGAAVAADRSSAQSLDAADAVAGPVRAPRRHAAKLGTAKESLPLLKTYNLMQSVVTATVRHARIPHHPAQ